MTCTGPDCDRPVFRRELCRGHYWQRHEAGKPLRPLAPRRQRSIARISLAAALRDDTPTHAAADGEFERNTERLRKAVYDAAHPARRLCVIPGCGRHRYWRAFCLAHGRVMAPGAFKNARQANDVGSGGENG